MERRKFIELFGLAAVGILLVPRGAHGSREHFDKSEPERRRSARYRINGNKRLGCSGFDFPQDPDILKNGQFMPQPF